MVYMVTARIIRSVIEQPGGRAPAPGALALVQDLINTVDFEEDRDLLRTIADLERFCESHDLAAGRLLRADVDRVRSLREALRDACAAHAGEELPPDSADTLDSLLAEAPLTLTITRDGGSLLRPREDLRGARLVAAAVAVAIMSSGDSWERLKSCGSQTCRWAYFDHSPSGRGRWCTMRLCGSRAKMQSYRARSSRA